MYEDHKANPGSALEQYAVNPGSALEIYKDRGGKPSRNGRNGIGGGLTMTPSSLMIGGRYKSTMM